MSKFLKVVQVLGVLGLGLGFAGVILKSPGLSALMLPGLLLYAGARLVAWFRSNRST